MKYVWNIDKLRGEKWRNVVGYEGLYIVSNKGNIAYANYDGYGLTHLNISVTKRGYCHVILRDRDGKRKTHRVHRLVAEAWVPKVDGAIFVNHKDENKSNNKASNLEWCTAKYNSNYGSAQEKRRASFQRTIEERRKQN